MKIKDLDLLLLWRQTNRRHYM